MGEVQQDFFTKRYRYIIALNFFRFVSSMLLLQYKRTQKKLFSLFITRCMQIWRCCMQCVSLRNVPRGFISRGCASQRLRSLSAAYAHCVSSRTKVQTTSTCVSGAAAVFGITCSLFLFFSFSFSLSGALKHIFARPANRVWSPMRICVSKEA